MSVTRDYGCRTRPVSVVVRTGNGKYTPVNAGKGWWGGVFPFVCTCRSTNSTWEWSPCTLAALLFQSRKTPMPTKSPMRRRMGNGQNTPVNMAGGCPPLSFVVSMTEPGLGVLVMDIGAAKWTCPSHVTMAAERDQSRSWFVRVTANTPP